MPIHSKSKSSNGASFSKRSQATGRQMGKAAIRASVKNSRVTETYIDELDSVRSASDMATIANTYTLARVTRQLGCGRLEVLCQNGDTADVTISGTIKFKGRAGTKTDRSNCMCVGDLIVVDGGFASAKLSVDATEHIGRIFTTHKITTPRGFFTMETIEEEFDWDREHSEETEAMEKDNDIIDKL